MTQAEWRESVDPLLMINFLERQRYGQQLLYFTIACFRGIWDELPDDAFRRVVKHAEQMGIQHIQDPLQDAYDVLRKLERRLANASDPEEESRLNRRIGFARMVRAFDVQHSANAARSISRDLMAWADDADKERRKLAEMLRELVPDPFTEI